MWVAEPGWQPATSFPEPLVPPMVDPDALPTVQVCVNEQWVPYIIGALLQLVQPVIWDVADVATLQLTIERATDLMALFANGDRCMQLRFDGATCQLQQSVDGGATWVEVPGWQENFDSCVKAHIPAQQPPNPNGVANHDMACNLAGYIASEILHKVVSESIAAFNASVKEADAATTIMGTFSFAFPITALFVTGFDAFYKFFSAGTIADFQAADGDPSLWSALTCAIYDAITNDGFVTGANLSTVVSNICGLTYAHPDVVAALCAFAGGLGLANWQAMQVVGAINQVDCSGCGLHCFAWPWHTTASFTLLYGGYLAGQGYEALNCPVPTCNAACNLLELSGTLVSPVSIYELDLLVQHSGPNSQDPTVERAIYLTLGGSTVRTIEIPDGAYGAPTWIRLQFPDTSADGIILEWVEDFSGVGAVLGGLEMRFTGANPFSSSPCAEFP